jgi:hypothetical protein
MWLVLPGHNRTEIETPAVSNPVQVQFKTDTNYCCCFWLELSDGEDGDGGTELPLLVSIPPGEVAPPVAEPEVKPKCV